MTNMTIGAAELEIMKVVWKTDEPIGSAAIGKAVEEKGWKRTTILFEEEQFSDKDIRELKAIFENKEGGK